MAGTAQQSLRFILVSFQSGRSGRLDMTVPRSVVWADVLNSLWRANQPAYIEIDPVTNIITELLSPLTVTIGAITPIGKEGDIEVELIISQVRHYLRRKRPDFQSLLQDLQQAQRQRAPVLVTETLDKHEIIDVRPLLKQLAPEAAPPPAVSFGPELAPVSLQRANELFNLVNAQLCCPASAAAPCIPFLYPDDGCWGRAH